MTLVSARLWRTLRSPREILHILQIVKRPVGVTGGVTSMPDFLRLFFPAIAAAHDAGPPSSAAHEVQYCLFDDQGLQLFTSSLYLAGTATTLLGSWTSGYETAPCTGLPCPVHLALSLSVVGTSHPQRVTKYMVELVRRRALRGCPHAAAGARILSGMVPPYVIQAVHASGLCTAGTGAGASPCCWQARAFWRAWCCARPRARWACSSPAASCWGSAWASPTRRAHPRGSCLCLPGFMWQEEGSWGETCVKAWMCCADCMTGQTPLVFNFSHSSHTFTIRLCLNQEEMLRDS